MQTAASRSNIQAELKETEAQSKFFNERVSQIEEYFGDLCNEFISYTRRTAKLRNNGDELSKILLNYSVNEKINRTTARTLKRFSELISILEDYRHAEVDRLFAKVITPLSTYGDEIKRIRTNIKVDSAARKKEVSQLKKIGTDRHASEHLSEVARNALHTADALESHVLQFEAKKLKGLKEILTDFVHIEMLWHAKALETLTEAFNVVQSMQEEVDLADFRNTLFRSGTMGNLSHDRNQASFDPTKSRSVPSLNSDGHGHQENLFRRSLHEDNDDDDDDEYDSEEGDDSSDEEEEEEEADSNSGDSGNAENVEDEEDAEEEESEESDDSEEEEEESSESRRQPAKKSVASISKSTKPLKSALKHPVRGR